MTKVLLVEDDNNLREIYEARLTAEGYDISSAQDGEEALVVAKQTKPDLVISDVMMPKISGFEMLDILRNTTGLEHVKVIMLTALGQSEDRDRADSLGADKYLVKSQVTLEDIVKTAHELLGDGEPEPTVVADTTEQPTPTTPPETVAVTPEIIPVTTPPEPVAAPALDAPAIVATPITDDSGATDAVIIPDVAEPADTPQDDTPAVDTPELATPEVTLPPASPQTPEIAEQTLDGSVAQEENLVSDQIENFVNSVPNQPVEAETPAAQESPTITESAALPETPAFESQTTPESTEPVIAEEAVLSVPPTAEEVATAADDQIMANAVDELAGGVSEEPAVIAPDTPEIIEPTPREAMAEADKTNISISGKKTIQPLSSSESGPDINELLAREEATTSIAAGPTVISTPDTLAQPEQAAEAPAIIHQPGASFAPQPPVEEAAPAVIETEDRPSGGPAPAPGGIDPNSIAL